MCLACLRTAGGPRRNDESSHANVACLERPARRCHLRLSRLPAATTFLISLPRSRTPVRGAGAGIRWPGCCPVVVIRAVSSARRGSRSGWPSGTCPRRVHPAGPALANWDEIKPRGRRRGAPLARRRSGFPGRSRQDDLRCDRLDGEAGTDRLGGGGQGLRPWDGRRSVRDRHGMPPAMGGQEGNAMKAGRSGRWMTGVAGPGPETPGRTGELSSVNPNAACPANTHVPTDRGQRLDRSRRAARTGTCTVMCAVTLTWRPGQAGHGLPTAGSAAGTGTSSADSQPGPASVIRPGMLAKLPCAS